MNKNLAEKVISKHLIDGRMEPGEQIGVSIDYTLTQDSTGTLTYLEFEAMGVLESRRS
jgi:aconitate hydratase